MDDLKDHYLKFQSSNEKNNNNNELFILEWQSNVIKLTNFSN